MVKANNLHSLTDKVFEKVLSAAHTVEGGSVSKFESQTFYRLTQNVWEGAEWTRRNEIIAEKFGAGSLVQAYENVMNSDEAKEFMKMSESMDDAVKYDLIIAMNPLALQ